MLPATSAVERVKDGIIGNVSLVFFPELNKTAINCLHRISVFSWNEKTLVRCKQLIVAIFQRTRLKIFNQHNCDRAVESEYLNGLTEKLAHSHLEVSGIDSLLF